MGIIHRVHFVRAGRDEPKWIGIEDLAASEGSLEDLAVSRTSVNTTTAEAG
jgi:hypothetical protein